MNENPTGLPWEQNQDELAKATFAGDFIPFEAEYADNVYVLVCKDVTTVTQPNKFKNNEPQTRLKFTFAPEDYTGEGGIPFWCSISTHKKSGFLPVLAAFGLPVPTEANPGIRKSMFVNKKCRGLLVNEPRRDNPTKMRPVIKQLLPLS